MTVLAPLIIFFLALFLVGAGAVALFILKAAIVLGLVATALFVGALIDTGIKKLVK
jgi:hypothetical protein